MGYSRGNPVLGLALAVALLAGGCGLGLPRQDSVSPAADPPAAQVGFAPDRRPQPNGEDGLDLLRRPTPPMFQIVVLHIRVPEEAAGQVSGVWQYLREEIVSGMTQLALRDNGLRVGVGHADWWDPVRSVFEKIEGQVTAAPQPVRVPAGFPLALELDQAPHDQTLFYVGRDGVLSGGTWNASRNVLRVVWGNDVRDPDAIAMSVVPEVRRQQEGLKIVRTPAGLWQVPRHEARAFDAAGFEAVLGPGEFIVIGPSVGDLTDGLLGDALLRQQEEGAPYVSYVILRPEVVGDGRDE